MKSGPARYNLRLYATDYVAYNQEKELFNLLDSVSTLTSVTISFWDNTDELCARFNNNLLKKYSTKYPSVLFEIYNSDNHFRFAWFDMINSRLSVKFDKYKFRYSYTTPESFKLGFSNFNLLLNAIFKINTTNEGYIINGSEQNNKNRNIRVKYIPPTKNS